MDLHRPSVHTMDRRRFLTALGFSAAAVPFVSGRFSVSAFAEQTAVSSGASPAVSAASGRLVLLSDTHVGRFARYRFTVDWLIECVSEITAMDPRPAHVLIYGDLSFNVGELGDYRMLREIFKPLDDAGIPWTPCMGNHDRRETFSEIFPEKAAQSLVPGHLVFKAETEYADFI
ncbi:MAG: metallophosphoesterase, partial [Thermoguttaceae bacterium]|nr:metallophosphoesterase [Thermoguttaceae bacterium]